MMAHTRLLKTVYRGVHMYMVWGGTDIVNFFDFSCYGERGTIKINGVETQTTYLMMVPVSR